MALAPVFVNASAANANNSTASTAASVTVSAPGNLVAGYILIAYYYCSNSVASVTYVPPSGWTAVSPASTPSATNSGFGSWFWKLATGSEPANYTFSATLPSSTANSASVVVGAWSSVNTSAPVDAVPVFTILNAKSASAVAPAVTAVADHTVLLCAYGGFDGYTSITAPSGMTTRASTFNSTFVANALCTLDLAAAGTTGTRTATLNPTQRGVWSSLTLAGASTGVASVPRRRFVGQAINRSTNF